MTASVAERLWGGKESSMVYLLSHEGCNVCSFHLEGAVVCPKVDRVCDAGATALVDHLSRLWARDVEFEVGIFLPVAEEKGKLEEESVVGVAQGGQGLGTGVSVQAALETFAGAHKLLPGFEAVWIGFLWKREAKVSIFPAHMSAYRSANNNIPPQN